MFNKHNHNKRPWYAAGLRFECVQCGRCCSGPEEGYIWVTRQEAGFIQKYLKLPIEKVWQRYLKRVGFRTTIIEEPVSKDCIFLEKKSGGGCMIYSVRPNQCRTWPFWTSNLTSPDAWNMAAQRCPGVNRGRLYEFDEIVRLKKQKRWWDESAEDNSKNV